VNTDGTGFYTFKECHKTESLWNHTTTDHKEGEQLEDRRRVGASSCNCGDGTDQRARSLMFMMMNRALWRRGWHLEVSAMRQTLDNFKMWGLFGSKDEQIAAIFWYIAPYHLQFVAAIQCLYLLKPLLGPLIRLQFPLFLSFFIPPVVHSSNSLFCPNSGLFFSICDLMVASQLHSKQHNDTATTHVIFSRTQCSFSPFLLRVTLYVYFR
jgi:hypothetical protein